MENVSNESSFIKSPDLKFYILITSGGILFFLATVFMYLMTPPFPKGAEGFVTSGHPIFYMISEAFIAFTLFGIASIGSILYLIKKDIRYDTIVVSSAKTGVLASVLTLSVGIFWSRAEWFYFWQWEARQTMTLIMFLFYVGMILFRSTVDELEDKAKLTAVFGLIAFPTVPMTNFIVGGLHPQPQQTSMSGSTLSGVILMFIGTLLIYIAFLYMTVFLENANNKLEEYKQIIFAKQE
ncbi:MAG: cytochrome c biogenesis protein CcsA [Candidatus Hodarchaeales archaeon]|jgi:heme exporter protein C